MVKQTYKYNILLMQTYRIQHAMKMGHNDTFHLQQVPSLRVVMTHIETTDPAFYLMMIEYLRFDHFDPLT